MQTYERIVGVPGVSNLGVVLGHEDITFTDEIYRSARPEAPVGYHSLKDVLGVRGVLCLETRQDYQDVQAGGMQQEWFPLYPFESVQIKQYGHILDVIAYMPKPLLVHCEQGHDRTGVVCAAYRITHGWSLTDAIEEMKAYGFLEVWVPLMESLKEFARSVGVG